MALITNLGGSVTPTFQPRVFGLAQAPAMTCIHLLNSDPANLSGTSLANLAYYGAPPSTIMGSPTISSSSFSVNTPGTDFVSTPFFDTGGDLTVYIAALVIDNSGTATTTPVLVSNYATDPARAPLVTSARGVNFRAVSATQLNFVDYEYNGSGINSAHAQISPTNMLTAWKLYAATIATVGTTVTLSIFNLTDGTSNVMPVTGITQRAWNSTTAFDLFTLPNGSDFGLIKGAFFAMAQSAVGAGGAHTPAMIQANKPGIQAYLAQKGITA
jgi:hypothetical protein